MSTASQKPHEEHIVDGDLYGRGKKRPKHGTEVTQMHSLGSQITDFMNNVLPGKKDRSQNIYVDFQVRYISLKPLDKREKKRQEKIQAMRRMVKNAVSNVGMLDSEGKIFKSVISDLVKL